LLTAGDATSNGNSVADDDNEFETEIATVPTPEDTHTQTGQLTKQAPAVKTA